jgi:predicted nucleic acid-binding protein
MVTTRWVLTEVGDALSAAPVRSRAFRFISDLAGNRGVEVLNKSDSWFEEGLASYGRHADKDWSLTDCISFAAMHARGIREALTADHHFKQAGFITLLD